MGKITSREELGEWLKDKPADWGQVIAARAVLRVLPYAFGELTSEKRIIDFVLPLIRAVSISWAARKDCQ
jgi:RimJ/RimL family protein N-acetyltransferase